MLDWLKHINKESPEFWKNYLAKFDKKSKRYVILSTQTTGTSVVKDVILTISAFAVIDDSIHIGDSFEAVLLQYRFFHDNQLSNEFIIESKMNKLGEPDAIKSFIDYLENAILVGHHIDFDVEMINAALERLDCGRLKNEALDIDIMYRKLNDIHEDKKFSLEELTQIHKLPKNDIESSTEDAYKIALLFLKLKTKLGLK
jgi:DNA polymerase III subunit epsilon